MGKYPNQFFKFIGAKRPWAEEVGEVASLNLVQDQRAVSLQIQVDWWEDLPFGQEIHGITTYNGVKYDATVVVQSSPKDGYTTNPIDSDYVKLTHHV